MANAPNILMATQSTVFLRRQADCSKLRSTWDCTEEESSGKKRKKSTLAGQLFRMTAFMIHLQLFPHLAKLSRSSVFGWFHNLILAESYQNR